MSDFYIFFGCMCYAYLIGFIENDKPLWWEYLVSIGIAAIWPAYLLIRIACLSKTLRPYIQAFYRWLD